uniref:ARID DNA-binding domain-containing protein n=1 Tax=Tanacetum cinerariifolium TaxID=118510 RepID=A0A6L2J918_TANCI|nr:ARID DNA-binding domain-containing protein [Tanacetum cinerariifolium]
MVNTNTFLEERWSSLHLRGCGHPNMWHQSKLGRPLRKRLQNEFIQRQLRRERESRLGNCIRQISKDCKEMLRKKIEEIEVYNSALPQTQSHKVLNKHERYKCYGCRIRGHIISNCPNKGRRFETANTKVKEEKTDQKENGTDSGTSTRTLEDIKMKMMQNKYLSDYYKLLEENPDYEEGKLEKETILTQKCYRCEEIGHYAYACQTKTTTVGYIPKGGDYVYVKGVFYPTKHCKGATIVQKKTTIFVDQGKELTFLQSHCGDQEDQVTAPIRQDIICQEKNRVEYFGIELEDIEETKKGNQHHATYQMKTKDHFEKGSTSIAAKKDERDTSSSSSDDFIIIS